MGVVYYREIGIFIESINNFYLSQIIWIFFFLCVKKELSEIIFIFSINNFIFNNQENL